MLAVLSEGLMLRERLEFGVSVESEPELSMSSRKPHFNFVAFAARMILNALAIRPLRPINFPTSVLLDRTLREWLIRHE
jgi:hypothetical protein